MKIYFDVLSLKPTTSIGTQAYIISGMQIIAKKYPAAEFFLLSVNPVVDEHYLKHTSFNYQLIKRDKSRIGTWRQVRNIIKMVDVVVSSWGDAYISTPPHILFRKALMLKKKGIPLILFTSSIGPFSGGIKRYLAVKGLKMFDFISVRDAITYDYLKELQIKNVKLVHDSAFVLKPISKEDVLSLLQNSGLSNEKYIGLNVSVLMYNLFNQAGRNYAKEVAKYSEWLVETFNLPVVLIPHQIFPKCYNYTMNQYVSRGGDDRFAADKVLELVTDKNHIIGLSNEYTPMELKGIIQGSEIFIGARMHSVIAALSTATPALIMKYSHKAEGMMKFLDLEENLWDINDTLDKLKEKTTELWNKKDKVREKLDFELPAIFEEIYNLANQLPQKAKK